MRCGAVPVAGGSFGPRTRQGAERGPGRVTIHGETTSLPRAEDAAWSVRAAFAAADGSAQTLARPRAPSGVGLRGDTETTPPAPALAPERRALAPVPGRRAIAPPHATPGPRLPAPPPPDRPRLLCVAAAAVAALGVLWLATPDPAPLARENPRTTALIEQRRAEAKARRRAFRPRQVWVSLDRVSPRLVEAVLPPRTRTSSGTRGSTGTRSGTPPSTTHGGPVRRAAPRPSRSSSRRTCGSGPRRASCARRRRRCSPPSSSARSRSAASSRST